jgi:hypothetical protein
MYFGLHMTKLKSLYARVGFHTILIVTCYFDDASLSPLFLHRLVLVPITISFPLTGRQPLGDTAFNTSSCQPTYCTAEPESNQPE